MNRLKSVINIVERDTYLKEKAQGWWPIIVRGLEALERLWDNMSALVMTAKMARPGAIGGERARSIHEGKKSVRFV